VVVARIFHMNLAAVGIEHIAFSQGRGQIPLFR